MSWNPSPEIATCRDVAEKHDWQQVIIIGIDEDGLYRTFSYGKNKHLCDMAKPLGDAIHDAVEQFYLNHEH